MTREELIAALSAPRLPEGAVGPGLGALIVAFGVGLLIALALFALARPAFRARRSPPRPGDLLARLGALPAEVQPLAAARLFDGLGAPLPEPVAACLYGPDTRLDLATLGPPLAAAWSQARPEARRAAHV